MALDLMRRPSLAGDLNRDFVPLRTMMDRLFENAFMPSYWGDTQRDGWSGGQFGMDVYESDDAYIVHSLLPGVNPESVNVSVQDNVLTISGESQRNAPENARPLFQEIGYGRFQRQVALGFPVEADRADASYHGGILTITLPKAEAAKPRQIKVHANGAAQ
jgi:HSP20 family protein